MLSRIAEKLIKKRYLVFWVLMCLTVLCAGLSFLVNINFNMETYLPQNSQTVQAMKVLDKSFGRQGLVELMVSPVTPEQATQVKVTLSHMSGVNEVIFDTTTAYKKQGGYAHFFVQTKWDDYARETEDLIKNIRGHLPELLRKGIQTHDEVTDISQISSMMSWVDQLRIDFKGIAKDQLNIKETLADQMPIVTIVALFFILLILYAMSSSWVEPILFLVVAGVAIVLNMGTNLMFGQISFLTASISALLQLALSMDYGIMLLHQYEAQRNHMRSHKENMSFNQEEHQMVKALQSSFIAIFSSSLTTVVGLLCLVVMSFTIGRDIGLVMAKGIVLSMLCVFLLLPTLILYTQSWIEKTRKWAWRPTGRGVISYLFKWRWVCFVILWGLSFGAYYVQTGLSFAYTMKFDNAGEVAIIEEFGETNPVVFLLPANDQSAVDQLKVLVEKDAAMINIDHQNQQDTDNDDMKPPTNKILQILSYNANKVRYMPPPMRKIYQSNFVKNGWQRMIVATSFPMESPESEAFVDRMMGYLKTVYPKGNAYMVSYLTVPYDMKASFADERWQIGLLTTLAIFLVVAFSLRSIPNALILVFLIQGAFWESMSLLTLMGSQLFFIAYVVTQCIQMGATIDYGILLTSQYNSNRSQGLLPLEAMKQAYQHSLPTIFTSGLILFSVTTVIALISTQSMFVAVCGAIARGTLLSMLAVLVLLPVSLWIFDRQSSCNV